MNLSTDYVTLQTRLSYLKCRLLQLCTGSSKFFFSFAVLRASLAFLLFLISLLHLPRLWFHCWERLLNWTRSLWQRTVLHRQSDVPSIDEISFESNPFFRFLSLFSSRTWNTSWQRRWRCWCTAPSPSASDSSTRGSGRTSGWRSYSQVQYGTFLLTGCIRHWFFWKTDHLLIYELKEYSYVSFYYIQALKFCSHLLFYDEFSI